MKKYLSLMLSSLVFFSLSAQQDDSQQQPQQQLQESQQQTEAAATYEAYNPNPTFINWCETYSDAVRRAKATSKPILILFTGTNWCPACMKLERQVLRKPEFIRAVANRFAFYKAEFNDPSEAALQNSPDKFLMDRYNVKFFPTIVVIDSNGRFLFNINYQEGGPASYIQAINQRLGQQQQQRYPR